MVGVRLWVRVSYLRDSFSVLLRPHDSRNNTHVLNLNSHAKPNSSIIKPTRKLPKIGTNC